MEPKCPLQLQDGSWPRGFISQETTVRPGNKRTSEGRTRASRHAMGAQHREARPPTAACSLHVQGPKPSQLSIG